MLRFHSPLIEPDVRVSRIRLSDKDSFGRPRGRTRSADELDQPVSAAQVRHRAKTSVAFRSAKGLSFAERKTTMAASCFGAIPKVPSRVTDSTPARAPAAPATDGASNKRGCPRCDRPLFRQFTQPIPHAVGFDGRERLAVHARRAVVDATALVWLIRKNLQHNNGRMVL